MLHEVANFMEHQSKIDIIIPTWYSADETSLVLAKKIRQSGVYFQTTHPTDKRSSRTR